MPGNDTNHCRILSLPEQLIRSTNTQRPPQPRRRCYSETANVANGSFPRERPMTGFEHRTSSVLSTSASSNCSSTIYSIETASQMESLDRPMSGTCPPQNPYALYLRGVPGAETEADILLYPRPADTRDNIHSLEGYWESLPAYSSGTRISYLSPLPGSTRSSLSPSTSAGHPDGEALTSIFPAEVVGEKPQQDISRPRLCGLPFWVAGLILLLSVIAIILSAALAAAKTGRHVQQQQQPQQTTTAYTTVTAHQSISLSTLILPPPVPSID
ncbi:uncharacterized protein BJX67DRAFT_389441 [Aspergillus lucknowensis]|uniref:Uncharacterized protein n=1 Tax=Aspergillus lucknowensis TaxID=176173 RepID=A0ABR4LLG7_9EURO